MYLEWFNGMDKHDPHCQCRLVKFDMLQYLDSLSYDLSMILSGQSNLQIIRFAANWRLWFAYVIKWQYNADVIIEEDSMEMPSNT